MWVQPEITQKLYVALWAAFLASCFFPYRLVGLAVGKRGKKDSTVLGNGWRKWHTRWVDGPECLPSVCMDGSLLSPQVSMLALSFS